MDKPNITAHINNDSDGLANHYNQARSPFGLKDILTFICPGDVVLDGGCGTGQHTQHIAEVASRVEGIDIDPARIAIAQNSCRNLENVRLEVGSVTKLPFPDSSFDVVLLAQVLHHLGGENVYNADILRQQCQQVIMEAKRVMKNDGRLILVTTSREQRRKAYWHFNLFPQSAWERLDSVWSLTEGEWFVSVMQKVGLVEIGNVTPSESHWIESQDEQMIHHSLDPGWRSTDVAFELLTSDELNQFLVRAETVLENGSGRKLMDAALAGRVSHGEATISAYEV